MLKNKYQEILVGLNLMSLVKGIISLKRNRSVLLIDDYRFRGESYPSNFLSEMEVMSLLRLGKTYDIAELKDLRQFLVPANIEFVSREVRLKVGSSPFNNLKEVLRKYPELIDKDDLDLVFQESSENFDELFFNELRRYEELLFESSQRPKALRFELIGPKWLKGIYGRLNELLNKEYSVSKNLKFTGLLHLLGLSSEEKLKTKLAPEEIPFYFFRLLSPIYRLQDFFLTIQLKRRLTLLGGDYKESSVQYWQLHENKFENLLLASFEGVISGERVLFFSHLPEDVPFKIRTPFKVFKKSQMTPVKRPSTPFPPTKLIFLTSSSLLGSDRPYRVLASQDELVYYDWPYPELPGSKAEFYHQDIHSHYEEDSRDLPFERPEARAQGIPGVTLDLRELRDSRKAEAPVLTQLPLEIVENELPVLGFEYWGPFRYRGMGLLALSYGVEGI